MCSAEAISTGNSEYEMTRREFLRHASKSAAAASLPVPGSMAFLPGVRGESTVDSEDRRRAMEILSAAIDVSCSAGRLVSSNGIEFQEEWVPVGPNATLLGITAFGNLIYYAFKDNEGRVIHVPTTAPHRGVLGRTEFVQRLMEVSPSVADPEALLWLFLLHESCFSKLSARVSPPGTPSYHVNIVGLQGPGSYLALPYTGFTKDGIGLLPEVMLFPSVGFANAVGEPMRIGGPVKNGDEQVTATTWMDEQLGYTDKLMTPREKIMAILTRLGGTATPDCWIATATMLERAGVKLDKSSRSVSGVTRGGRYFLTTNYSGDEQFVRTMVRRVEEDGSVTMVLDQDNRGVVLAIAEDQIKPDRVLAVRVDSNTHQFGFVWVSDNSLNEVKLEGEQPFANKAMVTDLVEVDGGYIVATANTDNTEGRIYYLRQDDDRLVVQPLLNGPPLQGMKALSGNFSVPVRGSLGWRVPTGAYSPPVKRERGQHTYSLPLAYNGEGSQNTAQRATDASTGCLGFCFNSDQYYAAYYRIDKSGEFVFIGATDGRLALQSKGGVALGVLDIAKDPFTGLPRLNIASYNHATGAIYLHPL